MPRVTCAECGAKLPPPTGGRPRTYCAECSPKRRRKPPAPPKLEVVPPVEPGPVELATLAELARLEQHDGPMREVALLLAGRIDSKVDSGHGLAVLSKTLRELLGNLKDTSPKPSPLDILRARRDAKRWTP